MRDAAALQAFVAGVLAMGYAVAALFFAKFRRRTGNRLFAWFAVAFVLLAVQRVMLATVAPPGSPVPWSFLLRLFAFVLILAGVVEQNAGRRATPPRRDPDS